MKSIRYILLSYFQQSFTGILYTVVGVIIFIVATLMALLKPDEALNHEFSRWAPHFFALLSITFSIAISLKNMIKNNTAALLPHYRRNQLIAAGLISALFILVPVVIRGVQGFPVLAPLAMFLFIVNLLLWGVFSFGENVLVMGGILWVGKLVHEMLGFETKIMIFGSLYSFSPLGSKTVFPLFFILLSCVLFFLFARYVLKMPHKETWNSSKDRTSPYTKDYDRVDPSLRKIVERIMAKRAKKMRGEGNMSRFQLARVFQPALFSPGLTYFPRTVFFLLVVFLYLFSFFYVLWGIENVILKNSVVPFLVIVYYLGAGMLTTDLLQHRHRLPLLWLQSGLDSRKTFTGVTILTYLMVAGKQFLAISLYFLLIPVLLPAFTFPMVLPMITAGFCFYLVILSLALLFSDRVVSRECKGWMLSVSFVTIWVFFIFFGGLIKNSFKYLEAYWYFLLILGLTGLFLFWRAYKKWMNTEMDFADPGEVNQY